MAIKKILCPTDFLQASNNAIEYAANLASKSKAELTLTHIMSVPEIYENLSTLGLLNDYLLKQNEVEEKLKNYSKQVSADFSISCNFKIDFLKNNLITKNVLGTEIYDLIICGTNGADTMNQFFSGSNSYRISKKSETPTLIVPETCVYKDINNLVFASGYNEGDQVLIKQLKEFMQDFNPSLLILHVSEKETAVSQEVYHAFSHLVDEAFDYNQKLKFTRIINEDEAIAIEHFMHESKADMLAVCMEEHGFLYSLFHKNLIKKLTSYADYPVLVFHK